MWFLSFATDLELVLRDLQLIKISFLRFLCRYGDILWNTELKWQGGFSYFLQNLYVWLIGIFFPSYDFGTTFLQGITLGTSRWHRTQEIMQILKKKQNLKNFLDKSCWMVVLVRNEEADGTLNDGNVKCLNEFIFFLYRLGNRVFLLEKLWLTHSSHLGCSNNNTNFNN